MNIIDLISIIVFVLFVAICAWRGLLKILSGWGAFFASVIIAKPLASLIGGYVFGRLLGLNGSLWSAVLVIALFAVLIFVFRFVFARIAELITKVLHIGALDKILGGLLGFLTGGAVVVLAVSILSIAVSFLTSLGVGSGIISTVNGSFFFSIFAW